MSSYVEGQELAPRRFQVTRADLVRYAGASGDRNPIHWSDRTAAVVGLPGVIAHGMYTMALAAGAVQDWAGGPGRVRELGAKFTKPVVVPDDDEGVELVVTGLVRSVQDGLVRVALEVTCSGEKVLGNPTAVFVG
ncbi:MAG: MaoC family dehydratase N-terminal domain-containing protein [Actinomycetota bacterium]|nr:MaoC family dehydratase N-terminal domain-containing protein [Actinomycetota bacterium]